jgi:hypothetical protein
VRLHHHCFKVYRRTKDECPACKSVWPRDERGQGLKPVGEEAVTGRDDGRRRARTRTDNEADDASQQKNAKGKKGKGKVKQEASDEEEEMVDASDTDDSG